MALSAAVTSFSTAVVSLAAVLVRRITLQVQGKFVERLLVSDLGHPTPKFEYKIQVIKVQRLLPALSSRVAITLQHCVFRLRIEIIECLGHIHQGIARQRPLKVQNTGKPNIALRNLGEHVSRVKIVMAEHRIRAFAEEVGTL